MGSTVELVVRPGPSGAAAGHDLLDWAEAEIERLEQLWSRFRPDSDVARLNASAGAGPVAVAPETVSALGRAVELWWLTGGLFDPTILPALEAHGYDRTFRAMAGRSIAGPDPEAVGPAPGSAGIVIDRARNTASLPAGVRVDLGGVGKGLTADHVAAELVRRGAIGACVSMGGDLRVAGQGPDDGRWVIDVEDPFDESARLVSCPLDGDALVTSTRLFRQWHCGAGVAHHLIDPRRGTPADPNVAAVVVRASEAWWAEGLAKAALIAGLDDGPALLAHHGVTAWMIDADRGVHVVGRD